ncbi:MAG: hypothetical protein R3F35_05165 [Myxococcota bacterium]
MRFELGEHAGAIGAAQRAWEAADTTRRLWSRDASIFSNADEADWLGWLTLPDAPLDEAIGPTALREAIARHPARFVVVLGMGGSSLWPDVLGRTWNARSGADRANGATPARPLHVVDTTVPAGIEALLAGLELEAGLYFVSSKSGSTIEPNALYALIRARLDEKLGREAAGRHFVAITDPGSALERVARAEGFLGAALGRPDVGGRFSALSVFGNLPALAMGLAPEKLLERARRMATACGPERSADENPGIALGLALGTLARAGRDKLSLSLSPALASFGAWIEQLIAESTGKAGRGLLPIPDEGLFEPGRYADDRIFVDIALAPTDAHADADAAERTRRLDALARAGHPVIRVELADALELGAAVFQWEMATAVIGSVLGLNPFDQPDVEAAKQAARERMASAARGAGAGNDARAAVARDDIEIFAARALAAEAGAAGGDPIRLLRSLVATLRGGDGFLINAFLADTPAIRARLDRIRRAVGRTKPVATTLSFGPRYLHSTGQLQKGGSDRLAGLQIWQAAQRSGVSPFVIPGLGGSFDGLAEAQAAGDFRILSERGRRMLGIALGDDPEPALDRLIRWLEGALA